VTEDSEVKKQRPDLYTEDELVELIRAAEERGDEAEAERWQDIFASRNNEKYERTDMAEDERDSQVSDGPPKAVKVNYQGNSQKDKKEVKEESKPKMKSVVHGKVTERKPGLGKRIKETFLGGESLQTVLENVVVDVVVPQVKDLMFDFVSTTVQRKLFGTSRNIRSGSSSSPVTKINYGAFSNSNNRSSSPAGRAGESDAPKTQRSSNAYENLVFENRGDAESVIDALAAAIDQYNVVTLSDLYEVIGHTGKYTDEKYGWDTMVGAHVARVRDGFLLELPRPKFLE
jgi:hypothetical protein